MAGGSMEVIALGGFSCMKQDTRYSCALIADSGWNYMGMESYGSGSNEKLSEALFAGLGIEAVNEEGMFLNKAIALDVPDNDSGTERNQLACMKPIGDSASLGLRISCSLLNAL